MGLISRVSSRTYREKATPKMLTTRQVSRLIQSTRLLSSSSRLYNKEKAANVRMEKDTMGELPVPADKYYGCQTARSVINFPIGDRAREQMPLEIVKGMAILKRSAAIVNRKFALDAKLSEAIVEAAEKVITD